MKVSLVDVDGHNGFPNLALMKLSAWHKRHGDEVDFYEPLFSHPDVIYASKVFTFTKDYLLYNPNDPMPIRGGTGYDISGKLDQEIENTLPDLSLYPALQAGIGFLSRGCIRRCDFCVVPRKEGGIRVVDDIERVSQGRKSVILMDNNFLANDGEFVSEQLSKAIRLGLKVDFNQGLDARLVTDENARLLAKVNWMPYIRFSCDHTYMVDVIRDVVRLLRGYGMRKKIFVYVLGMDVDETHNRIVRLMEIDRGINPFCQPYIDFSGKREIDHMMTRLSNWCNNPRIRNTIPFDKFTRRRHYANEPKDVMIQ